MYWFSVGSSLKLHAEEMILNRQRYNTLSFPHYLVDDIVHYRILLQYFCKKSVNAVQRFIIFSSLP